MRAYAFGNDSGRSQREPGCLQYGHRMSPRAEIHESNAQWIAWARRRCGASARADVRDLSGWAAAWDSADVALFNTILLSDPIADAADLERRIEVLREFLDSKPPEQPPLVVLCLDFIPPELRDRASESICTFGLRQTFLSRGMATDPLPPAARQLPAVECRRAQDEAACHTLADINSTVHRFPVDTGRATMMQSGALAPDFFGYIGYLGKVPIATSVVIPMNGCLHVLRVATLPEHRRRGYGEAVMRYSIEAASEATGLARTTLHTTQAGFEMYRQMGYRVVAEFAGFGR